MTKEQISLEDPWTIDVSRIRRVQFHKTWFINRNHDYWTRIQPSGIDLVGSNSFGLVFREKKKEVDSCTVIPWTSLLSIDIIDPVIHHPMAGHKVDESPLTKEKLEELKEELLKSPKPKSRRPKKDKK